MVYESEIKIGMILEKTRINYCLMDRAYKRVLYAVQKIYSLLYYFTHFVYYVTGKYH